MTFQHNPLSVSDPEDTQTIVFARTPTQPSSTIMEPMSIDDESGNDDDGDDGVVRDSTQANGQTQPPAYRNICFAVTFVLQLFAVIIVAFALGVPRFEQIVAGTNDFFRDDDRYGSGSSSRNGSAGITVFMFIGVSVLAAISLSGFSLYLMSRYSESCVMGVLVGSPVSFLMFALILWSWGQVEVASSWCIVAFISIGSGLLCCDEIPFASTNLKTGLAAIRAHYGVVSVSFLMALLGSVFSVVWWIAVGGVALKCQEIKNDDFATRQQQSIDCQDGFSFFYYVLLFLSYYWTHYTLLVRHPSSSSTCKQYQAV